MNEQILKEILNEMKSMKAEMNSMKSEMKSEINSVKSEMSSMKTEIKSIQREMVTKSDMEENTRILRALEHASQVQAAEMEGLKLSTATKESVARLEAKIDRVTEIQTIQGESINIIAFRQTNTEAEVNILRKAVR